MTASRMLAAVALAVCLLIAAAGTAVLVHVTERLEARTSPVLVRPAVVRPGRALAAVSLIDIHPCRIPVLV